MLLELNLRVIMDVTGGFFLIFVFFGFRNVVEVVPCRACTGTCRFFFLLILILSGDRGIATVISSSSGGSK